MIALAAVVFFPERVNDEGLAPVPGAATPASRPGATSFAPDFAAFPGASGSPLVRPPQAAPAAFPTLELPIRAGAGRLYLERVAVPASDGACWIDAAQPFVPSGIEYHLERWSAPDFEDGEVLSF